MAAKLSITPENLDSLAVYYADSPNALNWNLVFTLPAWLKVWWGSFGSKAALYLRSVKDGDKVIGIAPLQIQNSMASIVGNANVCDYQDFIVAPGREKEFYTAVLADLHQKGIQSLYLEPVRPDSSIVAHLIPLAQERQCRVDSRQVDVSLAMVLPKTWEEYLTFLDPKQRHELKRKIRHLQDLGETSYRVVAEKEAIPTATEQFLKLFPESRHDKAQFMTDEMQTFFRKLIRSLSEIGVVRFGILETAQKALAMVLYFEYANNIYLYNSAYDPDFKSSSVGIISKVFGIRDSIEKGRGRFDFLKGAEQYKHYLGGKEIPLASYRITL